MNVTAAGEGACAPEKFRTQRETVAFCVSGLQPTADLGLGLGHPRATQAPRKGHPGVTQGRRKGGFEEVLCLQSKLEK